MNVWHVWAKIETKDPSRGKAENTTRCLYSVTAEDKDDARERFDRMFPARQGWDIEKIVPAPK